jgi:DNA-binding XRE family transcriptional regulator
MIRYAGRCKRPAAGCSRSLVGAVCDGPDVIREKRAGSRWAGCTFNGTLALMEQKTHGPVTTAGEFLRAVENARALRGLTKAELARRSHVRAETVRHLLTADAANPTLTNALDMLRPLGLAVDLVELPGIRPSLPATKCTPGCHTMVRLSTARPA